MKTITEYLINNHVKNTGDYVDLELPSGTIWATMNIGATEGNKPEDWYGLYFAWGETQGYKASEKHNFSWDIYKFGTQDKLTKYNQQDKLNQLEDKDDAVYQYTHGIYRMPRIKEFEELYDNTDHKWVEDYNGIKGLNGRMFTSKKNETQFIFIPASGNRFGFHIDSDNYFNLLSSTLNNDLISAKYLYAFSNKVGINFDERCDGYSIRGVLNK